MFELSDFFHLPRVDELIQQIAAEASGLIIVAGPDPRPAPAISSRGGLLPGGRSAIFGILLEKILSNRPGKKCIVVATEKEAVRIPRNLKGRITNSTVDTDFSYNDRLKAAIGYRPGLLAIDRLTAENLAWALKAANGGLTVLAQLDTISWGTGVVRHLNDLGASPDDLGGLSWVVTVQRLEKLCVHCRQPYEPGQDLLDSLTRISPEIELPAGGDPLTPGIFYRPGSCPKCRNLGRSGDVAAFDFFRISGDRLPGDGGRSLLPIEFYLWQLALLGHLAIEDVSGFYKEQLQRTFQLLVEREESLKGANAAFERKLTELLVANRVLEQRTESLISFQEIAQALISTTELDELAARVCQRACALCGADRAILYYLRSRDEVEVLAFSGWQGIRIHQKLDRKSVFILPAVSQPAPFQRLPPGVPLPLPGQANQELKAGFYVPLIARGRQVGLMIIHSTQKPAFKPGEVALLRGFANQAALAIERTGLIDQLQAKIDQLEAARLELAVKERLEHELELARQVQQSVLPRAFPQIPGYHFAAHNTPARQVGGDFYDVIALDDDHFGVAIADVSDKGMPAALYMALTRSLLLAEARRGHSPSQVLLSIDRLLQELGQSKLFVTLFYGVIERRSRKVSYACAGHDRPALLRSGSIQFLASQGGPLGILETEDLHLSEETVLLQPGDLLALYTDGLVDLLAPNGEAFGRQRLEELLQTLEHLPAEQFCASVFESLETFRNGAEQYDDMALLVIEVSSYQPPS